METKHRIDGYFVSAFRAICNHCRVMAVWSSKTWNFCEQFLRLFWKPTPYVKIFKILFWKFSPPHQSTLLCLNIVKFFRREIGEIVRYLPDQKKQFWLPLKLLLLRGSRPKSARASPQLSAHSAPDFIHIGYSRTHEHFFCPFALWAYNNFCNAQLIPTIASIRFSLMWHHNYCIPSCNPLVCIQMTNGVAAVTGHNSGVVIIRWQSVGPCTGLNFTGH